jgi:hypothetical protein
MIEIKKYDGVQFGVGCDVFEELAGGHSGGSTFDAPKLPRRQEGL